MQRSLDKKIHFLLLNLPCFPTVFGQRFNDKILPADNATRATVFLERVKNATYDFLILLEIWDPAIADLLQAELKELFPHQIRGIKGDITFPPPRRVRSGMLIFSKQEILSIKHTSFQNLMLGEEYIGEKGQISIKVVAKHSENQFDVITATHLHADSEYYIHASVWCGGNAELRRDQQMLVISQNLEAWIRKPAGKYKSLRDSYLVGDFNTSLKCSGDAKQVNDACWLGIEADENENPILKKPGQYQLMRHYVPNQPINMGMFGGSLRALAENPDNPGNPETELVDMIAVRKNDRRNGHLTTEIICFDSKEAVVSDHYGISAEMDLSAPRIKRIGRFADGFTLRPMPTSGCFWRRPQYELKPIENEEKSLPSQSTLKILTTR